MAFASGGIIINRVFLFRSSYIKSDLKPASTNTLSWICKPDRDGGGEPGFGLMKTDLYKTPSIHLGHNDGIKTERKNVTIPHYDRFFHMHLLGRPGSGKSTLMKHMFLQDVSAGNGAAIIDPHGDIAEELIAHIPGSRLNDVVYINPGDPDYVTVINPLADVHSSQYSLVVSDIIESLHSIWPTSWGPRMEDVLRNTLFALIEQPKSAHVSFSSIPRMLTDPYYRNRIVARVKNVEVKRYFERDFNRLNERLRQETIAPVMNKIRAFLADPLTRNIFSPASPTLSIDRAMNDGRIIIINLAQGRIGSQNASLIGNILISMFRQGAQARVSIPPEERLPFFLYVDEVQKFATRDFIGGFAEVRKSKLGYIISHQYRLQLEPQILEAIKETVGSFIAFALGIDDAEYYVDYMQPMMSSTLTRLQTGEARMRISYDGSPTAVLDVKTPLVEKPTKDNSHKVINISRQHFSKHKRTIEELLAKADRPNVRISHRRS